jgi:putative ATP-dependent endonuclease of OLD family
LSASRDIFLDIRNRNSTWSRVTSNIKIPDDAKKGIQNKLDDVNSDIVTNSIVLSKLKNNMINTNTTVEGNVSISPLTKDIESLYKGMNLYYNLGLNTDIPVENLGMGTRSWAVFSTLKTSIELEYEKRIKENLAISTLFIVEEPEAHIHPQGQMSLIKGIKEVKAQKFITTHSQMMLSIAELADLKFVYLEKGKTKVVNNIVNGLLPNEVKKIYDKVLKPRGEIVFANQVIFCEGLSDEIALSYFYKTYFEVNTYEKGISIINVGGKDGYKPFLHIVKNLKIEWSIFSDGEKDAINSVNSAVYKVFGVEKNEVQNMDNVITLNGGCLESYLINDGYYSEILNAVNSIEEVDDYLRSYIDEQQGQKRKGGSIKNYNIDNGDLIALEDLLVSNKLKYIDAIVQEISKIDNYRRVPTKFRELFDSFNGGGETNGN